jgi:hypothetical protein
MTSPGAVVTVVMVDVVAIAYLSQNDISKLLGKDRHTVNVWRHRYPDFPAPDVNVGIGDRAVPGWHPERMAEIKAWAAARKLT